MLGLSKMISVQAWVDRIREQSRYLARHETCYVHSLAKQWSVEVSLVAGFHSRWDERSHSGRLFSLRAHCIRGCSADTVHMWASGQCRHIWPCCCDILRMPGCVSTVVANKTSLPQSHLQRRRHLWRAVDQSVAQRSIRCVWRRWLPTLWAIRVFQCSAALHVHL